MLGLVPAGSASCRIVLHEVSPMPYGSQEHPRSARWLMAAPGLVLLAWFGLAVGFGGMDTYAWWSGLGIPSMKPPFADARGALSGSACWSRGIDPYLSNPCDPWHRIFVYPRLWLQADRLGLGQESVTG